MAAPSGGGGGCRWSARATVIIVTLFILILEASPWLNRANSRHRPIRIGIGGDWRSLHPGLQHTMWAGMVLTNQFDTLVGVDEQGVLLPCGAKSWSTSADSRIFTFKIDTARRFSDGGTLTAADFKRSWEESYRLAPKSANSSLLDLLYKVEGFERFEQDGTLSGLEQVDGETFRIHFKTPFRMALDYLYGTVSAYRQADGKLIGTEMRDRGNRPAAASTDAQFSLQRIAPFAY